MLKEDLLWVQFLSAAELHMNKHTHKSSNQSDAPSRKVSVAEFWLGAMYTMAVTGRADGSCSIFCHWAV